MAVELDLFIDHVEADQGFVLGFLLPSLGLPPERVLLSSRLRPGRPRIAELMRGVERSRVTVLVLSPAYSASRWTLFTEQIATYHNIDGHRLVPLVLEQCPISLALDQLVCLDFTDRSGWESEVERLRRKIDAPGDDDGDIPCPYPGMRPFTDAEGEHFHGRSREVDDLIERVHCGQREIYVVGPSGSGKSSLVRAGVLPQLRAGLTVQAMRPGPRPRERLAEVLEGGREPGRRLLFVDQLEEVFTQADAEERAGFAALLQELRRDERVTLVLALRADFYGELLGGDLWPDPARQPFPVPIAPLRGEALRAAVEQPARDVSVYFEPRLVDRLLADAAAEPGVLPLLQDVLVQLWSRRQRSYVPLAAYDSLGVEGRNGMAVVLARRADAALASLGAAQQRIARRVFLSLVNFGEGRPDTRRSRPLVDLAPDGRGEVAATLEHLLEKRLLTCDRRGRSDEVWYDLAHEALITAWTQLRDWIETGRSDEQHRRALEWKANEWQRRRRGTLDPVELHETEKWLERQAGEEPVRTQAVDSLIEASRAELERLVAERNEYRRIVALKYQDQGRQLLLEGRPLRALPCFVAARQAGLASAPLRILFAQAIRNPVLVSIPHRGPISIACFSPDGARILTAGDDGTARVWDAASGAPISPPLRHRAAVAAACFSPDGTRVATASADHSARVWHARTGEALGLCMDHQAGLTAIAWSADGSRLLTASCDRSARIWDACSGAPVGRALQHRDLVIGAVFSPDGARAATASIDRTARVWDAGSGAPIAAALEHPEIVRTAAFDPDAARLVTACDDGRARIWDASSGQPLAVLGGPAHALRSAAFSPDGRRVVTAGEDRTARIWDAASGREIGAPLEHDATVRAAQFSPDGERVVTASNDGTARLWHAMSGQPIGAPLEHERSVRAAGFSPDGGRVVTACVDGFARVWRAEEEEAHGPCLPHRSLVRAAAFHPTCDRVVTASDDGNACLWDAVSGQLLRRLAAHDRPVLSCRFSPDGASIVTASADHTACIWRGAMGRSARQSIAHEGAVRAAVFSPDGKRVVTASSDRTARVWDAHSGQPLTGLLVHDKAVIAAAFSPDGLRLVTAGADGAARVWSAASGELLAPPLVHGGQVWSVAFSPDGRSIATAGAGAACTWDAASGELRHRLEHRDAVRGAAFSPDGLRLVTASDDKSARIWDTAGGKAVTPPLEHQGAVMSALFSPDGTLIVTASADRTARVWDATSGQPLLPPFEHREQVVAAAFSHDGARIVTASLDKSARVWVLPLHAGALEEWSALAERHSPFTLEGGILVPRGDRQAVPPSNGGPGSGPTAPGGGPFDALFPRADSSAELPLSRPDRRRARGRRTQPR